MPYASFDISAGDRTRKFHYRPGTSDEQVIRQIFMQDDYSLPRIKRFEDLAAYAESHLSAGRAPLIVDAGANIGASAVYFALKYPSARIVAIEPGAENHALLKINSEGLRIDPRLGAVSSRSGHISVVDPGEGFWGLRTEPAEPGASANIVPACTINDIYSEHETGFFPFIAKIDIEGGEKELFSQNLDWVSKTPCIIIELHDWLLPGERTSHPFLRCISQLDRDFIHIGENIFSIANDLEKSSDKSTSAPCNDTFYINLDKRPDKNERFLSTNGNAAPVSRFSAIEGATLNGVSLEREGLIISGHRYSDGALGCALSHRTLWQHAETRSCPVTVFEDDAVINDHFVQHTSRILSLLPPDWDIVLWGWNFDSVFDAQLLHAGCNALMYFEPTLTESYVKEYQHLYFMPNVMKLNGAFGTLAYTISPKGAARMTSLCFPLRDEMIPVPGLGQEVPNVGIDVAMNKWYPHLQSFAVFPPLVVTVNDKETSDISVAKSMNKWEKV